MTPDVSSEVPLQDTQLLMDFVTADELDEPVPVLPETPLLPEVVPVPVVDVLVPLLVVVPVVVVVPRLAVVVAVVPPLVVVVVPLVVVEVELPVRSTEPEPVPVDPETVVDVVDELSLELPPMEPQALTARKQARHTLRAHRPTAVIRFNNIHPAQGSWQLNSV
jgi:hypothetical protein